MRSAIVWLIVVTFNISAVNMPQAYATALPKPGVRVSLSPPYNPYFLSGIKIDSKNPLQFEFLMSQSDEGVSDKVKMQEEANKLVKYFLASITVPEHDLWVNLSPYEKDKVIVSGFGQTGMGRDLLAQDYLLKQITASLMYPEGDFGKKFWQEVYKEAAKAGVENIPVNTFNKVWIVPDKAVVYENGEINAAFVGEARLKVMLEQDYLASQINISTTPAGTKFFTLQKFGPNRPDQNISQSSNRKSLEGESSRDDLKSTTISSIIRRIIIPALEIEVNEGKNFAPLRQVYHSLILASWYKKKIKNSLIAKAYANKNKVKGTEDSETINPDEVYASYLKAFKKGVCNLIKEEIDPVSEKHVMRKYFAGGIDFAMQSTSLEVGNHIEIRDVAKERRIDALYKKSGRPVYAVSAALKMVQQDKAMAAQDSPESADLRQQIDLIKAPENEGNLANQLEAMDILTWRLVEGHVKDDGVLKDLVKELIGIRFNNVELAQKAEMYKQLAFFRFNSQKSQEIITQLVNQQLNVAEDRMKKLIAAQKNGESVSNLIASYGQLLLQVVALKDKYFDFNRSVFAEDLARFFEHVVNGEDGADNIAKEVRIQANNFATAIRAKAIHERNYLDARPQAEGAIDQDEVENIKAKTVTALRLAIARGLTDVDSDEIVTGDGVATLSMHAKELRDLMNKGKQQEIKVALSEVSRNVDQWPNEEQMPKAYLAWGKLLQEYESVDHAMTTNRSIVHDNITIDESKLKKAIEQLEKNGLTDQDLAVYISGFNYGNKRVRKTAVKNRQLFLDVFRDWAGQNVDESNSAYHDMLEEFLARWSLIDEGNKIISKMRNLEQISNEDISNYVEVMDDLTKSDSLRIAMMAVDINESDLKLGALYRKSRNKRISDNYRALLKQYLIKGLAKLKEYKNEDIILATARVTYSKLMKAVAQLQQANIELIDISKLFFSTDEELIGSDKANAIMAIVSPLLEGDTRQDKSEMNLQQWVKNQEFWDLLEELNVQLQIAEIVKQARVSLKQIEGVSVSNIRNFFNADSSDPVELGNDIDQAVHKKMKKIIKPYSLMWNHKKKKVRDRFRNNVKQLLLTEWSDDYAMKAQGPGGIDLTNDRLSLEIKENNGKVDFNVSDELVKAISDAEGLSPSILSITPIHSVGKFLGLMVAPSR